MSRDSLDSPVVSPVLGAAVYLGVLPPLTFPMRVVDFSVRLAFYLLG